MNEKKQWIKQFSSWKPVIKEKLRNMKALTSTEMRKQKFNAAMKSAISTMTMYEFLNIRGESRTQIKKLD